LETVDFQFQFSMIDYPLN